MKQRFAYIDRTKGLAILLVVIGHLIAREPPAGDVHWYLLLKHAVYAFHMPLFMAVSGIVYGLSWRMRATLAEDMADAARRALRLLPSYLLFGLLVFAGKWSFEAMGARVDNPVHGASDLIALVLRPSDSFCTFLWYVYALSLLYLAFPPLFRLLRGHLLPLLAITALFGLLPSSNWFAWDRLRLFTPFFVAGVIAGRHHEATQRWIARLWIPALLVFAALMPMAAHDDPLPSWSAAVLSLLALPGLMRATVRWPLGAFDTMGRYTLIIYLTNTIFIGLTKLAAVRLGVWDGAHFPLVALTMTVIAVGGAIVLKRFVLPWLPPLDRITT